MDCYKLFLLVLLLASSATSARAKEENLPLDQILKDQQELEDIEGIVLKGSVSSILNKDTSLQVSIQSILSSELNLAGDPVSARILIKDSSLAKDPLLEGLRGAVLKGTVIDVRPSRNAGRNGYVKVQFDKLILSSGKEVPVNAELKTESFRGQEALKTITEDIKLIGFGAAWGGLNSLRWAPVAAIYTHGLSVAVSAGVGASMGAIGAIRREGEVKTFSPGSNGSITFGEGLNVSPEDLSEALLKNHKPEPELIGLHLEPIQAAISTSDDFEHLLRVKVKVANTSASTIYPCDLVLYPNDGGDPVRADLRATGEVLLDSIKAGQVKELDLAFPLLDGYKAEDYRIVLLDPLDHIKLSQVKLQ